MKLLKLSLCAAAASFAMAGAAAAVEVSYNVGVASDYVFRGVSQTDEGAQIFGGVDLAKDSLYAGAWVSNVDFSPFGDTDTNIEYDLYVGVKPEAAGFSFDFAAIYYGYLNAPDGPGTVDLNYWEFKAAASRSYGPATVGAALYYSPEFTGETGEAIYTEVNGAYAFTDTVSASAALGFQGIDEADDYTTWNVGATWAFLPYLSADLRYHDSDIDTGGITDERVNLTLKAAF